MSLRFLHSIRWSVQAWHALLLIVVLGAFAFTTYNVSAREQLQRVDAELRERLQMPFRSFIRPVGPPPGSAPFGPPPISRPDRRMPEPFPMADARGPRQRIADSIEQFRPAPEETLYFVMWDASGSVLARSPGTPVAVPRPDIQLRREPPQPGPRVDGQRSRGEWREVFVMLPWRETLLVGRSMAPEIASRRQLAVTLLLAGGVVLLLGLAGGWLLASRAIRPIESIGSTAQRIAHGDLSQRIDVGRAENELGELAETLNATFARLETAFANQARFTADASHELRTPVAVILAQTQTVLSRERPPEEYREALEACQRAAVRMRKLTESLLQLARLDAGQEQMRREHIDVSRVVRESIELIRPIAEQKHIQIVSDLPAVYCDADAERLGQVATNLLSNAVQFNHEGGEIRVSTHRENGAACFSVADTGEGIPPEDVPHIFERFYRVDKARSPAKGRTGLGLSICKAVVEAHRGTIAVQTRTGVGSEFTVRVPA